MDYDFTANLEEELDAIAGGHVAWKEALKLFWGDFKIAVEAAKGLSITEVINHLDEELAPHFFQPSAENPEPRKCKACEGGRLGLKLGKFGAFIGCSNYPECKFTRPLELVSNNEAGGDSLANEPKILGNDPGTGRTVSLRRGPYGPYVQIDPPPEGVEIPKEVIAQYDADIVAWNEAKKAAKKAGEKAPAKPPKPKVPGPKRQGLPAGTVIDEVTLESALSLLALPRDVGTHPETGKPIKAGIGRFGPFLLHEGKYTSIPKDDDVMTIGMNRAVDVIAQKVARDAAKAASGDTKPARRAPPPKKAATKKAPAKKKSAPKKKSA